MTKADIYTIAGNGTAGYSGDAGAATSAELNGPYDIAVDASGNLLIADSGNDRIRVLAHGSGTFYGTAMTARDIYTVAGGGADGDGGTATLGELYNPSDVALDASGNMFVADTGHQRIRIIVASTGTYFGQSMTKGDIYTIAGNGTAGYSGDGGAATSAERKWPLRGCRRRLRKRHHRRH